MTSIKLSHKLPPSPDDIRAVQETHHRLRLIRDNAKDELIHWALYTIGFSLFPFLLNAAVLAFDGDPTTSPTLQNVFQIRTLMFVGLVVCGTILERLSSFDPSTESHKRMRKVGTFAYIAATAVLAVAYAVCTRSSIGGGGIYDSGIVFTSLILVGVVILVSALVYWLLHLKFFSPRRVGMP